jgi:hypothetical protein
MDDVSVLVTDDDSAGVVVTPLGVMQTSESGATTSLQVTLRSEPSHPVTFALGVTDPSEAAFVQSSITFTPMNWDVPQFLTVRGVDDNIRDGYVVYQVRLVDAVSLDFNYSGVASDFVTLMNMDDEPLPQIFVSNPSIIEGDSGTRQLNFEVSLSHASSTPVTVQYSTADGTATIANNDYIAKSGILTFAPGTSLRRSVTVDVVSDLTAELDETLLLNLSAPMAAVLSTGQPTGLISTDDNAIEVRLPNQFFSRNLSVPMTGFLDLPIQVRPGIARTLASYSTLISFEPMSGVRLLAVSESPNSLFPGRVPTVTVDGNR